MKYSIKSLEWCERTEIDTSYEDVKSEWQANTPLSHFRVVQFKDQNTFWAFCRFGPDARDNRGFIENSLHMAIARCENEWQNRLKQCLTREE